MQQTSRTLNPPPTEKVDLPGRALTRSSQGKFAPVISASSHDKPAVRKTAKVMPRPADKPTTAQRESPRADSQAPMPTPAASHPKAGTLDRLLAALKETYQESMQPIVTVAHPPGYAVDIDKLSSVLAVGLNMKLEEARGHASTAVQNGLAVRANISQEAAVDMLKRTGFYTIPTCEGSGHDVSSTMRKHFVRKLSSMVEDGAATVLLSPSVKEVHAFPTARYHYFPSDVADGARSRKICPCRTHACKLVQLARSQNRVSYGPLSSLSLTHVTVVVALYVEGNADTSEFMQLFQRQPYLRVYSAINVSLAPLLSTSLVTVHGKTKHSIVDGEYVCELASGDAYIHPVKKISHIFQALVGQVCVKRTTIVSFETEYLTELTAASGSAVTAWRPELMENYVLPNFLVDGSLIIVPKVPFDKAVARCAATEDITLQGIINVLMTNSLTITLSGINLVSRLPLSTDSLYGLAVFILLYVRHVERYIKQEVHKQELKQAPVTPSGVAGAAFAVGFNASRAVATKIGIRSELFESKTLMDKFRSWFVCENMYRSIEEISDFAAASKLGPALARQSLPERLVSFYKHYGFKDSHKQLYDKSPYSARLAAELLGKVVNISISSLAQATLDVARIFRSSFVNAILGLLYVLHTIGADEVVDKLRSSDYPLLRLFSRASASEETEVLWMHAALAAVKTSEDVFAGLASVLALIISSTHGRTLVPVFRTLVSLVAPQKDWYRALVTRFKAEEVLADFDHTVKILSDVGLDAAAIVDVVTHIQPAKITTKVIAAGEEEPLSVDSHPRVNVVTPGEDWAGAVALEDAVRTRCPQFFSDEAIFPVFDPALGPLIAYPPVLHQENLRGLMATPLCQASKEYKLDVERELFLRNLAASSIAVVKRAGGVARERLDRDKASHKLMLHYDLLIAGLPMSGKSALVRGMLDSRDIVVVPTGKLQDDWNAALEDVADPPKVLTQHAAMLERGARYVVVDEVYTYSCIQVASYYPIGEKLILLGDPSQIGALFSVAAGLTPFDPAYFVRHADILLPYSFCPQDVVHLLMWQKMDTIGYKGPVFAFSPVETSLFYANASEVPYVEHDLVMVVTQCGKGKYLAKGVDPQFLNTAHESQGSRCNNAGVVLDAREANFYSTHPAHFRVALSRSREKTVMYVESMTELRKLQGIVMVNGSCEISEMFNTAAAHSLCLDDTLFAMERPVVYKHEDNLPTALFTMDDVAIRMDQGEGTKSQVNPGLLVVLGPGGGKTTLARRYHGVDIDTLFTPEMWEIRDQATKAKPRESAALWKTLNKRIAQAILALDTFPRLLFTHSYGQVSSIYPRIDQALVIIHTMQTGEKSRDEANDSCTKTILRNNSKKYCVAKDHADVENLVMGYILKYGSLCNVSPILGTPTFALSDGMPSAVDSLDLGSGNAIRRIKEHILREKMAKPINMAKPESWVASHINAVNRMAVEDKVRDPLDTAGWAFVKARVMTLFKTRRVKVVNPSFQKNSQQWLGALEASDDPEAKLYSDFHSKAFAKAEMPKKTSDLLKVQGVIYKGPAAQLLFSTMVKQVTEFVKLNLREGIVADIGYTEDEMRLRIDQLYKKTGRTTGPEFDLDKQDTSHNKWHVKVFSLIAELAGVGDIYIYLFEQNRAHEFVECLDHALKMLNHWSLGSGAPWTLIANIIMALTTLVVDYDLDLDDIVMQKGDDGYVSRMLVQNAKLYFPNVSWKWRLSALGSFCSKVYAVFIIRKMGRRMWKLTAAQPTQPGFVERLRSHHLVLADIRAVGHDAYGEMLDLAFDTPPGSGFTLVCEYEFTYLQALRQLPEAVAWSRTLRATRIIVSTNTHCAWRAILAVGGAALADKYIMLRRRNVTLVEIQHICAAEGIALHVEKCKYNKSRQARVISLLGENFRGIVAWHDHAIALVDRVITPEWNSQNA